MKKIINNKGITLIALGITIIVLLILAGVTITTLTGKNGLLTKTGEVGFKTEIAKYKEELELYKTKMFLFDEDSSTLKADTITDPTIQEIIKSMTDEYAKILRIEDGNLVYIGNDKEQYIMAEEMGLIPEDALKNDDIFEELKPFITEWTVADEDTITLPINGTCDFTVDYGDGTEILQVTSASDEERIHTYEKAGTYTVTITGQCENFNFAKINTSKDKIIGINQWGGIGERIKKQLLLFFSVYKSSRRNTRTIIKQF